MTRERRSFGQDRPLFPPMRPIKEIEELRRRFEQDIARPFIQAVWDRIPEGDKESWGARWSPPVDVIEKSDHILVIAELPGMKDNIDLSVSDNALIIKGEKNVETVDADPSEYFLKEIAQGAFYRAVPLPVEVDPDGVDASYEDGFMRVILPRLADSKARRIKINVKNKPAK